MLIERCDIMLKVSREFNVYKYDELSEDIQNKIIEDYVNFLMESTDFSKISKRSNLYRAYKKANDMQTIWFLGSYIWEYCENMILKAVRQDYYLKSGEVFVIKDNDIVSNNNDKFKMIEI